MLPLQNPQLYRKIFFERIAVTISIGIHPHELAAKQEILLDIDLFALLENATPTLDKIKEVVDYDFVMQTVNQITTDQHINLQETLCDRIGAALLYHPKISHVRVSSEKTNIYPNCRTVGVERWYAKGQK